MSDRKFTLLELHLGDGNKQFGPRTISTGGLRSNGEEDGAVEFEGDESAESSGGLGLVPLVVALVVLVVLVVVAKKVVGGDDLEDVEDLDELGS